MSDNHDDTKRRIDRLRDGAISMQIGPGDGHKCEEAIGVGNFLFIVRLHDIYKIILADKTDPKRTNIAVPNAQQKVCNFGAEDSIVGATLLTAHRLIKSPTYFGEGFGVEAALELVFNCTQELIGLRNIAEEIQKKILDARKSFVPAPNLLVPHVDHLATDLRTYFEKTKHLYMYWFDLIKKFFPEVKSGQLTKLLEHYETLHPEKHPFKDFLADCVQYHDIMKHGRDAIIHPRSDQRLEIRDFTLEPASEIKILNPSFRLISPHVKEQGFYDVQDFITKSTLHLVEYTEYLVAFLACYSSMARHSGSKLGLCLLPPDRQRNNVRLSYSMTLNGQSIILG